MMTADRYEAATRGEDLGIGADEPSVRRFTRPCERVIATLKTTTPPTDTAKSQVEDATTNTQQRN